MRGSDAETEDPGPVQAILEGASMKRRKAAPR